MMKVVPSYRSQPASCEVSEFPRLEVCCSLENLEYVLLSLTLIGRAIPKYVN